MCVYGALAMLWYLPPWLPLAITSAWLVSLHRPILRLGLGTSPLGSRWSPSPRLVGPSVRTLSTVVVSPVDRSHTLAVRSSLPVASCRPSGLKSMLLTHPVWP